MINAVEYAFPAGDESDGSNDEWDIGLSSSNRDYTKGTDAVVPEAEDGTSAMKQAVYSGNIQLVQQLLDNGVDVETRLSSDWTPLMCAAHAAHHDVAKLLLDRGASANYSKNQYTVLMAAVTASSSEDKVVKCVELLLSRNADPNMLNSSHMTAMMLAARDGHSRVINLLVSHGAEVNVQDDHGYTALAVAVQYGRQQAVLKLLELGADRNIKTHAGKSVADLAMVFKQTEIARVLACPGNASANRLLKRAPDPTAAKESLAKLGDVELLLHGLDLVHLADIMTENDITWSHLLTMETDDLQKIGITDPEDQNKVLSAVKEMERDRVDMDTLNQLENIDSGSEELCTFLISLRQQCCYLTESVQDVNNRFPLRGSELVLSLDPKKEAQAICNELVAQTGDLQKEVSCLRSLLSKMDQAEDCWQSKAVKSRGAGWIALSMLGAGVLCVLLSRVCSQPQAQ